MAEPAFRFEPCARQVDGEVVRGLSCDLESDELYHHTEAKNLASIRESGALVPGDDPFSDGTVNFTANPNFHRFGSIRFVFDRAVIPTVPMCYTYGDEDERRQRVVERRRREALEQGKLVATNRIENREHGAESWAVYRNECKHFTREPVPLKGAVKRIEYWLPWHVGGPSTPVGANVVPCHADWSAGATGIPSDVAIRRVQREIADARSLAEELGAAFEVRTCYPWVALDQGRMAWLNEANLNRLVRGEPLETQYRPMGLKAECLCPRESIPVPEPLPPLPELPPLPALATP